MTNTKKGFKGSTKYDSINSTFKHCFYLTNGIELIGYSKKVGYNESTNKINLLINQIIRFYSSSYLDKKSTGTSKELDQLQYFLNGNILDPILSLSYLSYEVMNVEWCNNNFKIIQFLDKFYHLISNDRGHEIIRLKQIKRVKVRDTLSLERHRFLTVRSLNNYIKECLENKKASAGELTNFFHKYIAKYQIK